MAQRGWDDNKSAVVAGTEVEVGEGGDDVAMVVAVVVVVVVVVMVSCGVSLSVLIPSI